MVKNQQEDAIKNMLNAQENHINQKKQENQIEDDDQQKNTNYLIFHKRIYLYVNCFIFIYILKDVYFPQ